MIEQSMAAKFDYLVDLGEQSGHKLHETRTFVPGSGDADLAALVDVGLPAFALIFHPALQIDYEMRCEGLAQWNNRPAWVVYFEQSKKKRPRTVSMGTAENVYPVGVKGRAWVAADSGQIMHMDTNLLNGLAALELRANAVSVDYARKISLPKRGSLAAPIRHRLHGIFQAPHHHSAHFLRLPALFHPNPASHSEVSPAISGTAAIRTRLPFLSLAKHAS